MNDKAQPLIDRDAIGLPVKFEPPAPGLETQVAKIFQDALRIAPIGAMDDFYDLGGDSLQGEEISLQIEAQTGFAFPISGLFDAGTPRAIAASLDTGEDKDKAADEAAQEILFVVHGRRGYTVPRRSFLDGLSPGSKLVMFEMPGLLNKETPPESLRELAEAYVAEIERVQPEGPVRLASFCVGGLVAIEMVHILRARGRPPVSIVMLDPRPPKPLPKRLESERAIRKSPWNLFARLRLFGLTGRLDPDKPFLEPTYRRLNTAYERIIVARGWGRHAKADGRKEKTRYAGVKMNVEAQARLTTAMLFAWPDPLDAEVHILGSRQRSRLLTDPDGFWGHLLPNRKVYLVVDSHQEILRGESATVAGAMEDLLLGRGCEIDERPAA
ncbi:hypothetical protein KUV65_15845 [Maritalea mobilis]|uniref:thioesterase domain-containing protein n=1 Tax=Maritalea mobilis TaxID=483324 RepID=UPI001C94EE6A|nr:thioesterase domain-containing protein [Maritalea mobilis]MBY6202846.1 hypothetical protein [Maritalea mobilis]